jgi:chaperonin cofactor prefoldin
MVRRLINRRPSSEVKPSLDDRVEALEKQLNEILETYDAELADRLQALEQTLQRHGIRN